MQPTGECDISCETDEPDAAGGDFPISVGRRGIANGQDGGNGSYHVRKWSK